MSTLENKVEEVVKSFIDTNQLFTALDVSNEVKKTFPFSRHREVRDIVRVLFTCVMTPAGYGKTPINVKLADGTPQEAILYHHVSDSWDLDTKYDDQKRAQTVVKGGGSMPLSANQMLSMPTSAPPPVPSMLVSTGVPGGGTVQTALANAPAPAPVVVADQGKVWDSLFDGVRLFP